MATPNAPTSYGVIIVVSEQLKQRHRKHLQDHAYAAGIVTRVIRMSISRFYADAALQAELRRGAPAAQFSNQHTNHAELSSDVVANRLFSWLQAQCEDERVYGLLLLRRDLKVLQVPSRSQQFVRRIIEEWGSLYLSAIEHPDGSPPPSPEFLLSLDDSGKLIWDKL